MKKSKQLNTWANYGLGGWYIGPTRNPILGHGNIVVLHIGVMTILYFCVSVGVLFINRDNIELNLAGISHIVLFLKCQDYIVIWHSVTGILTLTQRR